MDTEDQARYEPMEEAYKPIRRARRYRINSKKFARTLALLGCMVAGIVAAVCFSGGAASVVAQAAPSEQVPLAAPSVEAQASALPSTGGPLAGKTVVLDAGHGGFDIGATGVSGEHESDLNLKMAGYVKADFEQQGAKVTMTRSDANAIDSTKDGDMAKRREIAQQSGSDIFVSVHMNADTDHSISGPIVLYQYGAIQSEKLAKLIQSSLLEELAPASKNSARAASLYVLEENTQPSVLVECGFITNAQEEALLLQDDYQKKVALAITQGCLEFLQS